MVLLVNGRFLSVPPSNLGELYDQYPHLFKGAENIAAKKPVRVEPSGIVYVRQKKWAVTYRGDIMEDGKAVVGCGTEDVLTCHVIILREPHTGVTAIAHFDEFTKRKDFEFLVTGFLNKIKEKKLEDQWDEDEDWEWVEEEDGVEEEESVELDPSTVYELHLVGGYKDDAGKAAKISQRFFRHLYDLPVRFELSTCCLGHPNTKRDGGCKPIVSGVLVDINTGEIKPSDFNRTFTDFEPGIRDMLMIFPPLRIAGKTKSSLRQMIVKQEDRGFGKPKSTRGC